MQKSEKQSFVSELSSSFSTAQAVFITQQTGLTVSEATDLRRRVRAVGAQFRVAKNTLARIALEGTPYDFLKDHLSGPTAIAFTSDPVAVAKVLVEFAEANEKLKVLAGAMNGEPLSSDKVVQLSRLPSLNEIRATLAALLVTPATQIARITAEPAARVARVVGSYSRSQN